MFSIVFYSKTIGKQKNLSEWVNPTTSGPKNWHTVSSDILDQNCKCFLETYFVFLNHLTKPPTEVVHLTEISHLTVYFIETFVNTKTLLRSKGCFYL